MDCAQRAERRRVFLAGVRDGVPIGLGYLAVAFSLGIAARNAGLNAFQGFLIIICIAIYAVLVQNMLIDDNISTAIWLCMGYTVLLCFTLFKTSSLAKSIFNSH